jgi:glycosyltransferase involved in cell wall biosynthesis
MNVRAIKQLGPAIFQANLKVPAACQYALAAASVVRGVETVAVEHLPYPLDGRLQLRLKQLTSRRLGAHVAVGERVARQVEHFAALRPGTIRTIYNGVADPVLEPIRRAENRVMLGTIARLDRQKGLDVLLHAMSRLPDAHLTLVGDGEERSALQRLAAELELADRVRFAGACADARRYLTAFDVFVLPSRFEGFPLAIIEAMLASLPVVASAVGSVPEAVLDGRTGLLVPVGDSDALARAIAHLLASPELRARLGAAGRERALRFTPASMARAYERLYQELLG